MAIFAFHSASTCPRIAEAFEVKVADVFPVLRMLSTASSMEAP